MRKYVIIAALIAINVCIIVAILQQQSQKRIDERGQDFKRLLMMAGEEYE